MYNKLIPTLPMVVKLSTFTRPNFDTPGDIFQVDAQFSVQFEINIRESECASR